MVNTKTIAVGVAAVILIVAVTAYASSYMSDFDNVRSSSQDEGQLPLQFGQDHRAVRVR